MAVAPITAYNSNGTDGLSQRRKALIRSLYTRHGRKKSGFCICEGVRCCTEVFQSVPEQVDFVVRSGEIAAEAIVIPTNLECVTLSSKAFAELAATVNSQGVLAIVKAPDCAFDAQREQIQQEPFLFVLDQVGDPGNFGTMLRTARAAGLRELWYTKGSVDPFSDKVIRSALGAQFSMRLREFESLDFLRNFAAEQGFDKFFLTDPHEGENCFGVPDLFDRSVLVIGSEAHGVGAEAVGRRIKIPMPGNFESLNAAQAATIVLFEYVRRISVV